MLIETILEKKGHDVATLRPDQPISAAVTLMAERRIGAVVVEERGKVVGIFSERDLVKLLARDGSGALEQPVRKAMTAPVITCRPEDRVNHVMAIMDNRHVRHMPVMDGDRLCGMISIRDINRQRIAEKELESATLLDISRMHG